jgi:hypothetical protein
VLLRAPAGSLGLLPVSLSHVCVRARRAQSAIDRESLVESIGWYNGGLHHYMMLVRGSETILTARSSWRRARRRVYDRVTDSRFKSDMVPGSD